MTKSNPFAILGSMQGNVSTLAEMILVARKESSHKSHDISDYEGSSQNILANRFVTEIPIEELWSKNDAHLWCEAFWALHEMGARLGSESDYSPRYTLWQTAVDKNEVIASFIADKMLRYGIPGSAEKSFLLHHAVKNNHEQAVQTWLSSDLGKKWGREIDPAGRSIVSYASTMEMLSTLERHDFDLRQVDQHGFLPEVYFFQNSKDKTQREIAAKMTNWLSERGQPDEKNHIGLFAAAVAGHNFSLAKKIIKNVPDGADFRQLGGNAKNMLLALSIPGKQRTPLLRAVIKKNIKVSLDGVSATGRTLLMEFLANGLDFADIQQVVDWLVPQINNPSQIGLCKNNNQSESFLEHLLSSTNNVTRWNLKVEGKSLFLWLYEQNQFDWIAISKGQNTIAVLSNAMLHGGVAPLFFEDAKKIWPDLSSEPVEKRYAMADALWINLRFRFKGMGDAADQEKWLVASPIRQFWFAQCVEFIEAAGYRPEGPINTSTWLVGQWHMAREKRLLDASNVSQSPSHRPKI